MKAHDLVSAIGPEAAVRFAEAFGGSRQDCPNLDAVNRETARNAAIWSDLCSGMTYRRVAQRYGITERWVRQVEANMREVQKILK